MSRVEKEVSFKKGNSDAEESGCVCVNEGAYGLTIAETAVVDMLFMLRTANPPKDSKLLNGSKFLLARNALNEN